VFNPERFASGDERYAREVVREHEPLVLVICRSFAQDDDHLEDLAQETWKTVCANIDSFRAEGTFRAWLSRVCTRVCLTDVRTRKTRAERAKRYAEESKLLDWHRIDPLAQTEQRQLQHAIYRALPELSDGERDAVTYRILEGRPPAECAELMGVTQATVRSHLRHAINRLRRMLEDPDHDLSRYRAAP